MDIISPALPELLANVDKESNVILLALMLAKLDLQMLFHIVTLVLLISTENKDISAMLTPLDFTNAFEMLSAPLKPRLNLNSSLALLALNADAETPIWNARLLLP